MPGSDRMIVCRNMGLTREGPAESVLKVRMVLLDSEPAIWRRLDIRGSLALNQMHQILQVAFGWEKLHLHRFTALELPKECPYRL